eukprot:TRINITY_DN60050_c0_g1_i1.p1 TRINITY_DN60050_c0_g1~~TRINITY_DN60050_c0_g1_i1.p1  ORF type:complete len:329 (+),score=67.26 TRINITY_DN60050_c0_g1_i1:116-988(+)
MTHPATRILARASNASTATSSTGGCWQPCTAGAAGSDIITEGEPPSAEGTRFAARSSAQAARPSQWSFFTTESGDAGGHGSNDMHCLPGTVRSGTNSPVQWADAQAAPTAMLAATAAVAMESPANISPRRLTSSSQGRTGSSSSSSSSSESPDALREVTTPQQVPRQESLEADTIEPRVPLRPYPPPPGARTPKRSPRAEISALTADSPQMPTVEAMLYKEATTRVPTPPERSSRALRRAPSIVGTTECDCGPIPWYLICDVQIGGRGERNKLVVNEQRLAAITQILLGA